MFLHKSRNSSGQNQSQGQRVWGTGPEGWLNVTIKEQRRGKSGILSLRGSFVGRSDVSVFEQAIFGLLRDDILYVVLDLSPLKFIDSAGLGAMISAMVSVGRREGALKLAAVQGDVQRIVKNMNLDQVFELYDTVDQAEASFGKKARS